MGWEKYAAALALSAVIIATIDDIDDKCRMMLERMSRIQEENRAQCRKRRHEEVDDEVEKEEEEEYWGASEYQFTLF